MSFATKIFIFLLFASHFAFGQRSDFGKLQSGDLLFQDLDCGPLCDAIEQVTQSYGGRHFSHIGLIVIEGDSVFVIEAIGAKVQQTPLHVFLQRSTNEILLGRVKSRYEKIAMNAVVNAQQKLGITYDDAFIYNNGKYYCSELLYDVFKEANHQKDFFSLSPMTFKKPNTNSFFPVWIDYYQRLNIPIPEGQAGINPGGISLSRKLKMYRYKQ